MENNEIKNSKYIYLTTKGRKTGNPHTVELWFAADKDKVYLSHEGTYTDWMKNINKDNRVEFRIGNSHFKGKALIIKEKDIFETAKYALYNKYYGKASKDVIDDWFSESTVIEITNISKKE
jgi:deazaflavin-dependent oxidoreductase (nitroreductase family)